MNTLIKVCGMRDQGNIHAVQQLGVDMVGMIFWDKSPRFATHPVITTLPIVGVFVDEEPQRMAAIAEQHHLSYIQLHGSESAETILGLRSLLPESVRIIKALSIREADDVKRWRMYDGMVDMLLFDTKCTCVGGSGEHFDWSVLQDYDGSLPFLLSGGIGPDDADRLQKFHHPMLAGFDLNSRFEIDPGLKDINKLEYFLKRLND